MNHWGFFSFSARQWPISVPTLHQSVGVKHKEALFRLGMKKRKRGDIPLPQRAHYFNIMCRHTRARTHTLPLSFLCLNWLTDQKFIQVIFGKILKDSLHTATHSRCLPSSFVTEVVRRLRLFQDVTPGFGKVFLEIFYFVITFFSLFHKQTNSNGLPFSPQTNR